MKKILLLPALFICTALICSGQAPHAFKYQAVIRDTTGTVISNQLVSLRISILKSDINGEVSYSEIHDVQTNALGLVNLEIGRGLAVQGDFTQIPWGEDNFFIQIEIDMEGAMNYQLLGTSQLLAVPYALYAEKSGSDSGSDTVIYQWKESGDGIYYDEGNVGIGTSEPVSNLHIEGTSVGLSNRRFLQLRNNSTDNNSCVSIWLNSGGGNSSTFLGHHAESYSVYNYKYQQSTLLWNDGQGLFFRTRPESKFIFESYDGGQYSDIIELMRLTGDGKLGLGTGNPEAKVQVEGETSGTTPERDFLWLKNNATDNASLVWLQLSSGDASKTTLEHRSYYYTLAGDENRTTAMLWNHGKGLYLRTSSPGLIALEFYDGSIVHETARFTGDGMVGVGTKDPQRTLHVDDVMRLEPRSTPPENPAEGDIYMDSSDHLLKVYDGTAWQSCW